ncbi:MAG TPA: DUF3800 domain-containing protein [Mycobacteriales bacterium]|jgi:hypothetical protein|nr:DUF3800 domain-containing protein [Mycobacteriales bacterium]
MPHYVFADESGNVDFSRGRGATDYFSVGTLHVRGDDDLAALRAHLARLHTDLCWRGLTDGSAFHASEDAQRVRDEVFAVVRQHPVVLDVTLVEKAKVEPGCRVSEAAFFEFAWRHHMATLAPAIPGDEVLVVVAAVGTRRLRAAIRNAITRELAVTLTRVPTIVFAPAAADPALQATDYLLWAVARAWERGDDRALVPVADRVRSQRDALRNQTVRYY